MQNLHRDYAAAIRRLHELGVMVNGSFVFGMDEDGEDVFDRTVDWAVAQGIETATFHVLTPYPGTALHGAWTRQAHPAPGLGPVRHAPRGLSAGAVSPGAGGGYWRAYRDFYRWANWPWGVDQAAIAGRLRHLAYAAGWKKFEPLWDWASAPSRRIIRFETRTGGSPDGDTGAWPRILGAVRGLCATDA